jgi:hypothetical protein
MVFSFQFPVFGEKSRGCGLLRTGEIKTLYNLEEAPGNFLTVNKSETKLKTEN